MQSKIGKLWFAIALMVFMPLQFPALVLADEVDDLLYEDNDASYIMLKNYKHLNDESDFLFSVFDKVDLKTVSIPECHEVPIAIDRCIPSACHEVSPFGKVYRKIKGKNEKGDCLYIERTPGYGGIDCTFPKDQLANINFMFDKHFFSFFSESMPMNDEEIIKFKKLIKTQCEIKKDKALTRVVKVGDKVKGEYIDPEFKVSIAPQVPLKSVEKVKPISPDEILDAEDREFAKDEIDDSAPKPGKGRVVSIMFTPDEVQLIDDVLEGVFFKRQQVKGIASIFKEGASLGSFYLNSILYFNNDKWAVWLNNFKFASGTKHSSLAVSHVTPEYAEITWITSDLDKVSPSWRRKMLYTSQNRFTSQFYDISVEVQSEERSVVKFSLRPNQTFEVTSMSIIEGAIQG